MGKIEINNFTIADLEQAIKNVLNENIFNNVLDNIRQEESLNMYSREATADMLCVSLPTLNEWTKQGIIRAFRIGGRVLYKLEDINNSLKEVKTSIKRGGKSC
ncbi:helix-turn-helix domain-containing protein [Tamlana fucoidanivorans]|uniref:Helix-turn-helix domain-containing protein n=1 Tax=Allotamlana fucoidanivorans TaxID=2583814 RepID=A0A5C4SRW0_9FLAO|nr:helix-turn-helix domain-containing protein [Tamlana fucoidanivorans]TNJ47123.1 helix-turn-helix domain-containing protein [Tamlana fucoidanivorans]